MANKQTNIWQRIWAFVKWHPVLFNLIAAIIASVVALWLLGVVFLGIWTNHGDTVIVPQVKGLQVDIAKNALQNGGFEVVLDSLYDSNSRPGMVVDQSPRENSKVKEGRTIYLRYICYNPKKIQIPQYQGLSERSVAATLAALGIRTITPKYITGNPDEVLGIRYNGLLLHPGDEVPVGASLIIEVGRIQNGADQSYYEEPIVYYNTPEGEEEYIMPEDIDEEYINSLDFDF